MTLYFVTRLLVVWLCGGVVYRGCATRVWLDDHGRYQNMVVAVHPALSSTNCTELFTNLQNAVSRFSAGLQTATDGRVDGIGRVQVVLPQHMAQLCHLTHLPYAAWQRWSNADLRIVPEGDPWQRWAPVGSVGVGVRQVDACSRPGDYMTLSASSLMQQAGDGRHDMELLGRSLVAGWARYRWGVFEERGYTGHARYPLAAACQQDSSNCTDPHTSSLLQRVSLPQTLKFCDIGTHDYESPNLQNLACYGRSVSEVIHHHQDLAPHNQATTITTNNNGNNNNQEDVEVVRPHSGVRIVNHHSFHVEGDIRQYLNKKAKTELKVDGQDLNIHKQPDYMKIEDSSIENNTDNNITDAVDKGNNLFNSSQVVHPVHVNWKRDRVERAVPFEDFTEGDIEESTRNSDPFELLLNSTQELTSIELNDTLSLTSGEINATTSSRQSNQSRSSESFSLESSAAAPRALPPVASDDPPEIPHQPPTVVRPPSIRPEAAGFSPVSLELMVSPQPVVVVSLDLSQAAVDEVGVDTLRGGLLRWMWGLGGGFRLSIIAAYNNESFPLNLSPLPPSPRTATQLESRLALLPTEQEAATGVYGGRYCLFCVLEQAAQLVTQGGATVESAVLIIAACRPKVGPQERKILEYSGLTLHTIALCSTAEPEFDRLSGAHKSWVMASTVGPHHGQRQLARTLQAIMLESTSTPQESMFAQLHEHGRPVRRSELESSGAYALVGGQVHLTASSAKRLLLLSATSPAKVVEIRDNDGRRLETVRDTGSRFWVEVLGAGSLTYTFKFLSTSLNFPLRISEEIYEQRTELSGIQVQLRTSTNDPLVPGSPPVVVWADVTIDGWPVVGAAVTLTVTHLPSGIAANYSLLDSGNTDPDLRSEDGVYSRYLTWRLGEGRYSLTAHAQHADNTFMVTTQHDGRLQHGSSGTFSAVSAARTMYVTRVSFEDTAPPSRITDLNVQLVEYGTEALVNISWSAPGGNLDQGAALRYELKVYTERLALTEDRFNESGIIVYCLIEGIRSPPPPPAPYGTEQHCLARVPFTDLKWYFAIRGVDSANNTGRVSNIVWLVVPKPPPTTSAVSVHATPQLTTVDHDTATPHNVTAVGSSTVGAWRPYVVAGAAVLGLLMVGAATLACVCCCRKAKSRKEKDPDRPVYKIYVNNAYIQEDDGEIKVVQEWVNSLDKYGNVEGEVPADGTELKNKASFKYTSPVRFGVLTNGSIMRDATTGSNSSGSSRPSEEVQNEGYKYRDLSETTSDSTTDGLPPSSSSSAATEVLPIDTPSTTIPISYPSPVTSVSFKNTNISSLPLPSPRKNPPATPPPKQPLQLSLHSPISINDYTSEEEGGFRPRGQQGSRGSPVPHRRQLPQHFSSFRYLPPPPQYRGTEYTQFQPQSSPNQQGVMVHHQQYQEQQPSTPQHSPAGQPMQRVNGSLSHGTVRSVKKRRHISFV